MMEGRDALYVYDLSVATERAQSLAALSAVDQAFYAIKANAHPDLLRVVEAEGLGFECVSWAEVEAVKAALPGLDERRILFTPNFAPRREYEAAVASSVNLTLDGRHPLEEWSELFAGRDVWLRFNPDRPRGHHRHVHTAGPKAKFGWPVAEAEEAAELARKAGARVVGLHAHAGSGVELVSHWHEIGVVLGGVIHHFPDARAINVGGGLGIPKRIGDAPLNLAGLDAALTAFKSDWPGYQVWMEPGRFVSAECGVLLARVTQIKHAHGARFIGLATGMNSLMRPALYDAYHPIVNLSRPDAPDEGLATIVGPICESADALGLDRDMPDTREGDILLIANTGAYGRVMATQYNMRPPAEEAVLKP